MGVQIPNCSLFPEIDFASKCIEVKSDSTKSASLLSQLLSPLSNANSKDVRQRIRHTRLFVGVTPTDTRDVGHIEVAVNPPSGKLRKNYFYG